MVTFIQASHTHTTPRIMGRLGLRASNGKVSVWSLQCITAPIEHSCIICIRKVDGQLSRLGSFFWVPHIVGAKKGPKFDDLPYTAFNVFCIIIGPWIRNPKP